MCLLEKLSYAYYFKRNHGKLLITVKLIKTQKITTVLTVFVLVGTHKSLNAKQGYVFAYLNYQPYLVFIFLRFGFLF